jgi:hypothetical protein
MRFTSSTPRPAMAPGTVSAARRCPLSTSPAGGRVLSFVNDGPDGHPQINLYPGYRIHLIDALTLTLGALG